MVLDEMRKTEPAELFLFVIKKFIDDVVVPSFLSVVNRSVYESTISKISLMAMDVRMWFPAAISGPRE